MKKIFEVTDKTIINEILDSTEYGTLALCVDNKPYSVPINFMRIKENIYFHGAKKGKKMDMIKNNSYASFSVVEALSLLPSYFSSDDGLACPASQLFKSVIIDGKINVIQDYDEKVEALEALMQKLQQEGKYIPLNNKQMYEKAVNATAILKLSPSNTVAKFKAGQHWDEQRYEKIVKNLEQRATPTDLRTLELIKKLKT